MSDSIKISAIAAFSYHWNQGIESNNSRLVRIGKSSLEFFRTLFCGRTVTKAEVEAFSRNDNSRRENHEDCIFLKECNRRLSIIECQKEIDETAIKTSKTNPNDTPFGDILAQSNTPLMVAAREGKLEDIKRLLKSTDNDVNQVDSLGYTALHMAAENGHVAIVEILLSNGADANIVNRQDATPLHLAVESSNSKCLEVLLRNVESSVVNAPSGGSITTIPLADAAHQADIDTINLLLNVPTIDVNAKGSTGDTALHSVIRAPREDNGECLNALLKHPDIDANPTDSFGNTPLVIAMRDNSFDRFEMLLDNKHHEVDVNKQGGKQQNTPLHEAILIDNPLKFINKLLERKDIKIDVRNEAGFTPLEYANKMKKPALAERLKQYEDEATLL